MAKKCGFSIEKIVRYEYLKDKKKRYEKTKCLHIANTELDSWEGMGKEGQWGDVQADLQI